MDKDKGFSLLSRKQGIKSKGFSLLSRKQWIKIKGSVFCLGNSGYR